MVETDKALFNPDEAQALNQSHCIQVKGDNEVKLEDNDMNHLNATANKSRNIEVEDEDDLSRA